MSRLRRRVAALPVVTALLLAVDLPGPASATTALPGRLSTFGDSIVRGVGASVIGETNWTAVLGRDLGAEIANFGVDSSQVFDHADPVFAADIGPSSVSTWMGVNDQRLWGSGADYRSAFASAHLAEMVWLALPNGAKVRAAGPEVALRGEWTANSYVYGGGLSVYSSAAGSSASMTVSGSTVYVATIQQPGNSSVLRVSVDGVGYGDVSTASSVRPTLLGRSYGPALLRISGLAAGPHQVEVAVASADADNPAHVLWAAGSGGADSAEAPTVFVGNVIRQTAFSYEAHGGSEAGVAAYGATVAENCALLRSDGLDVVCVDVTPHVDPDRDLEADGAHPNDVGHLHIAQAFRSAMVEATARRASTGDEVASISAGEGDEAASVDPASENGYWLVGADGGVFAFGGARFLGSTGALRLSQPVVTMAARPSGRGYWLVGADGGVFAFGDAPFHGSTGALRLKSPIVAAASSPSGDGYWLVGADGGVFAFGDAGFHGSTGATRLARPIVAMAVTPSGRGYWLVGSDGGVFAFGDARFRGSAASTGVSRPIVSMMATPSGDGYWLVGADGGVFAFGDARFHGSAAPLRSRQPIVAAAPSASGRGYRLVAADGETFRFGDATDAGSTATLRLSRPVVGAAKVG